MDGTRPFIGLTAACLAFLAGLLPDAALIQQAHAGNASYWTSKAGEDPSAAFEDLKRQAADGDPQAQVQLGMLYRFGIGAPRNWALAAEWIAKAAKQGDPEATYRMGYLYKNGYGVALDRGTAFEWFKKAAEKGNPDARYELGLAYLNGWGAPVDVSAALQHFRAAADAGHPEAVRRTREIIRVAPWLSQPGDEAYGRWLPGSGRPSGETPPAAAQVAEAPEKPDEKELAILDDDAIIYTVQLASVSDPEAVEPEWQRLQQRLTPLLDDKQLTSAEVDLGKRGVFHRLFAGPFADEKAAARFCEKLRARGQYCLVTRQDSDAEIRSSLRADGIHRYYISVYERPRN